MIPTADHAEDSPMTRPEPDLKAIFSEALDHPAGLERSAYLDRACEGDAALRLRVESILEAHDQAGAFLGSAAGSRAMVDDPRGSTASLDRPAILEGPGTRIGPYKLLQQIGEGGMGVVFMAEQEHPVRRKVALKVVKPGMDTRQVIARFEAERQALAMMDHPNIARVLDVGATETGRPYFVMELVKGVPITEYCDRNHLTPRERLELFIPVCKAIQSAHQKGIIHRDIKPSNVLVTLHDGQPLPKVIDFGVAKAIDQRLTEKTMFTEFGAVIGTLEYMSPEQAEMGALDVDTRSDIYSLGVLLYELLTGSTPLERAKLRLDAFSEILRRIREEEPTKPSTRLSESKETLPSISAQRKMEPARLTKLVRGDLDWIVMKALEKDRTRRYETATGFARDIQRYLDGDPVEACPPSAAYKLRKYARKHRTALATAAAFALGLIVATAVSVVFAYWANRERARAVKAEEAVRVQKERSEERERLAIDAVKRYGDVIGETPELKNNLALAPLRARLLKEPQEFFRTLRDRLQSDKETTPESLGRLATASFDLGNLTAEIGDKREALRAFEEALEIRERLARENPTDSRLRRDVALSLDNIGLLQQAMGRPAEAMASHRRALAIRERLASEDPTVAQYRRDLAASHNNIGLAQYLAGRPEESIAAHRRALEIRQRLVDEAPSDGRLRRELAQTLLNIGTQHQEMGRSAEGLASLARARAILERLASENPADGILLRDLSGSHNNIGNIQLATGRRAEALASYERAMSIQERLASASPTVGLFQRDLAASHNNLGFVEGEMGRPDRALASYQQALAIRQRLASDNPSVTQYRRDLGETLNDLGSRHRHSGRTAEAMAAHGRALEIRRQLVSDHPESPDLASDLGATLSNMALIDLDARRFDEARAKLNEAVTWQRRALAANPNQPDYRQFLMNHLKALIMVAEGEGRAAEAEEARRELAAMVASDPTKAALDAMLAAILRGQAPGDDAERLQLASRAYEKALHALAARLFAEAHANDPKLTNNRQAQHAYNAACAAALAGCGQGKDDPPPDDAARAKLRRQALDWLKGELAAWAKLLDTGPAEVKATVALTLQHWKSDADLAGIRDEKELAKLPEAECAAFRQLWADVDRLLARASGGK
jgi:eukaryotic-like serine/threonine-protein kinase